MKMRRCFDRRIYYAFFYVKCQSCRTKFQVQIMVKDKKEKKIEYPPLKLKKWIPPDKRLKRKSNPKYVKPDGVSQKLAVSNLVPIWHQFRVYKDRQVLLGNFSQNHKRFTLRSNGFQTPCNCVVAIVYSQFCLMKNWCSYTVDTVLYIGNDLYMNSVHHLNDRTRTNLLLCEVYPSFYFGDTKVTFTLKGNPYCGTVFESIDCPVLCDVMVNFFNEHQSGIFTACKKHVAVWSAQKVYYLFDPTDHDRKGYPWLGLRGKGFAAVMRFQNVQDLVNVIQEHFGPRENPGFVITPCSIIRLIKIKMFPPDKCIKIHCPLETPQYVPEPPRKCPRLEVVEEEKEEECVSLVIDENFEENADETNDLEANDEYSPEVGTLTMSPSDYERKGLPVPEVIQRTTISDSKIPIERPRPESVTYFTPLVDYKMGIIRAATHQYDLASTPHRGKQAAANVVSALAMLRVYKSKEWFGKIVTNILKYGDKIYEASINGNEPNEPLKLREICKQINYYKGKVFMPEIDEYASIGRLQSTKEDVLDLAPALQEFFRCNQTGVITTPLMVAVWFEDDYFYMFDGNERDEKGLVITKSPRTSSRRESHGRVYGYACVTWYSDVQLLVDTYMKNLDPMERKAVFILAKVVLHNFEPISKTWNNFEGIACGKWILQGTFNQNDRRFDTETRNTQCTAAAAIMLSMAFLKPLESWNNSDVDEVLIVADDFYKQTVQHLKDVNKYHSPKLLVDELLRRYKIGDLDISLEIKDCLINGLLDRSDDVPAFDLKRGVVEFFKAFEYGILTCREISVAIWKIKAAYFYYDSHSRDGFGNKNNFGTACILRFLEIEDLVKTLVTNFDSGTSNLFNISSFEFVVWESSPNGSIRPPLNNYVEVNPYTSILRSNYSNISTIFKLNVGMQTIPMCLSAVAMMKLYPANMWNVDILEEILRVGDKLYTDTMVERERREDLLIEDDINEVYAENCLLDFYIGMNKFTIEYQEAIEGDFENHFKALMNDFYAVPPVSADDEKELFITNNFYNVMTWFDGNVYYLFDPKPRDETGQIIGKEEWSAKIVEDEEDGIDLGTLKKAAMQKLRGEDGGGDGEDVMNRTLRDDEGKAKHSPSYWRVQEEDGRACTMWFLTKDHLIDHVYENTPPNRRADLNFKLIPITVHNNPELKRCFDPTIFGRESNYAGDWYQFREVDYGRWILRGLFHNKTCMFPPHNRGKQQMAMCYAVIAFIKRFAISKFNSITVNNILKYGDKLYSVTRRTQSEGLKNNCDLNLTCSEIEEMLNRQCYGVADLPRAFCIGTHQMQIKVIENVITGDVCAKPDSEILDVKRGIGEFFQNNKMGFLVCKNLTVAIWRGVNIFYMFDSNSNGPCGLACPSGEACITRYLEQDMMSEVILKNLEKEGRTSFFIHMVKIRLVPCPRPPKPEEKEMRVEVPKFTGITGIMPGKCILRGSLCQEHEQFNRGVNAQSAAIAIIALSMSLVHKPCTWTCPIIDDILYLGDELYGDSLKNLGCDCAAWEKGLTLYLVNRDYKIGSLCANFEIRDSDQRGMIDIKNPCVINLREGIKKFFEENTHGVIETDPLTVAIWEEEEQPGFIYMYDPNPRGPGGFYLEDGTACLLIFETAQLAADHFIGNIPDKRDRLCEFVIIPIEIVVGSMETKSCKKKTICCCARSTTTNREPTTYCDKKVLHKLLNKAKRKRDRKQTAQIGTCEYYVFPNGDAILRGTRSQTSKRYSENTRGKQDIPNCFAAFVVHRLAPVCSWYHKHIDMILDIGDQLYKDSYITYNPKDPKLGMKNVLRKVFIKDVQVTLQVYKPVMSNVLNPCNLDTALTNYFMQECFGILYIVDEYVALFCKEGCYYMFDPHDRNVDGNRCYCEGGTASVMKFESICNLVDKYMKSMIKPSGRCCNDGNYGAFTITLVTIESIVKKVETPCIVCSDN
ncbi:hypothetical protein FQA39_LY17710 [Lamprigera yunnana]|nr:hypothetical protein FQA39_LY17710 [Lamprigera yunnana]